MVVLSCERSVAMHWLIPHLKEFQAKNPDIVVKVSVGGGSFDFKREGITLALRRMDFKVDPTWRVERLFDEEMGPVLAKGQMTNFFSGQYIALCSKTRPNAWKQWLEANPKTLPPKEYMFFDHHFLMIGAALNGLGVGLCPKALTINDISDGQLIAPSGFQKDDSYYGLIYQEKTELDKESDEVRKWLLEIGRSLTNG